jgi:hypothetical protein
MSNIPGFNAEQTMTPVQNAYRSHGRISQARTTPYYVGYRANVTQSPPDATDLRTVPVPSYGYVERFGASSSLRLARLGRNRCRSSGRH